MSIKVISYNQGSSTVMGIKDVLDIVEENMGSDVSNALESYISEEKMNAKEISRENAINYIEDGIWYEQIQESDVVYKIYNKIVNDLKAQGYIKKTKDISKFELNEAELVELIDESLSEGIRNYFS